MAEAWLTPTEFHNMLGRAGRPGLCDRVAQAVVCLPLDRAENQALETVERYYGPGVLNPQAPLVVSTLFSQIDIQKARRVLALDSVTYPTFRSVMDALRHVSGGDRYSGVLDVVDLLRKTLFCSAEQAPRDTVEQLVTRVLDAAAEEEVISRTTEGGRSTFKIKPEAEALIDTGTTWQSVKPMRRWLEMLPTLKKALSRPELPTEILVPAFVCSDDLWIPARTFCWEFGEIAPAAGVIGTNEDVARKELAEEMNKLGLAPKEVSEITTCLIALVDASPLPLPFEGFRRAVFYRLVAAFLQWLRGADPDDMSLLSLSRVPTDAGERTKQVEERSADIQESVQRSGQLARNDVLQVFS